MLFDRLLDSVCLYILIAAHIFNWD